MEESALLLSVYRIVGSIEIENYLFRRTAVCVKEQLHKQPFNGSSIVADFMIPGWLGLAQLKPVQGALSRKRRAVRPACRQFPRQHCQHWIMPKLIMLAQVLIAESHADHPLRHQRPHAMFDQIGLASIQEASREPLDKPNRTIRSHPAAVHQHQM